MLFLLVISCTLCGVFCSAISSDPQSQLRGVPEELREKILAFHRVLSAPDNFTSGPRLPAPPPPPPPSSGPGLQEYTEEDERRREEERRTVKGEIQTDLFRFSDKVSVPHSSHTGLTPEPNRQNFVSYMRRKDKLRQRIQREWRRFIKWRAQKRKKKRLKRRIRKALNKRLKKHFGKVGNNGKRTREEVKAFKRRKKMLKKRIRRRFLEKRKMRRMRLVPGQASLPEQRLKQKQLLNRKTKKRRGKKRKGARRRQRKRE